MTQHIPTADAKFAKHTVHTLMDYGCSIETIQNALGEYYGVLGKPLKRIPVESMTKLYRSAALELDDPLLGARLGFDITVPQMGVLAKLLMASATLKTAMKSMILYRRLLTDIFDCELHQGPKLSEVRYRLSQPIDCSHHQYDAIAAAFKSLFDALITNPDVLFELTHDDQGLGPKYESLFKSPIRFNSAQNRIVFPTVYLDVRAGLSCSKLQEETFNEAHEAMRILTVATNVNQVVTQYIRDVLIEGEPTITDASEYIGMRPRTLQARLAEEGHSFRSLLAETRFTLAQSLLREHKHTSESIARQLGYQDVRAYYSAFKRWTGYSPQAYQQSNVVPHTKLSISQK